jgi:hypothetical protein
MAGGSKNTTTTVSNNEPWKGAQPALNTALSGAQNLYNAGVGSQVYSGPRVTDQSSLTQSGLASLANIGDYNSRGQGLSGQYQNVINSGGYNSAQMDALNNTRNVANSQFDLNSDPGWAQVRDATIEGVNLGASGMGRTGSGTNQTLLASNLADAGARQYQNFLSRRDAANSSLFNMGNTGFGQLGAAYTGLQAPSETMLNVGRQNEARAQQLINANMDAFDERQNRPWENLSRLNAIASGAGSLGGSSTNRSTQPGQSPLLTGLGYAAGGLGLLGGGGFF